MPEEINDFLLLDMLAQRYGMLPSRIEEEATTADIEALTTALTWERLQNEKAKRQSKTVSGRKAG